MMAHLDLSHVSKSEDLENTRLHCLPCMIKYDGEAPVSAYFEPVIRKKSQNSEELKASFRGYPLLGKEISIPKNYYGLILEETSCEENQSCDKNQYGKFIFDKFTYWNWDSKPCEDDKIVLGLDWLDVAEALHIPIDS